jgi:general secretion pathway protein K
MRSILRSERGMALILTIMILAVITAMVIEFAYGVFTATSALYNWRDGQRLSAVALSGVRLAVKTVSDIPEGELYRFTGSIEIPVEGVFEGFTGTLIVTVTDENGKFNLNALSRASRDRKPYEALQALLRSAGVDVAVADRIADWVDSDSEPRLHDSEEGAKNGPLDSLDELLFIKGIDREIYGRLLPHVTIYGMDPEGTSLMININSASIPVIMSVTTIDRSEAEKVRDLRPFKDVSAARAISPLGTDIAVTPTNLRITAVAEENRIRRIIECVLRRAGAQSTVLSWREM